jgi:hypothetical protein
LRYTAQGTHNGCKNNSAKNVKIVCFFFFFPYFFVGAHKDIPATNKTARWSGSCIFRLNNDSNLLFVSYLFLASFIAFFFFVSGCLLSARKGKIVELVKDFNKLALYEQLGWNLSECIADWRSQKEKKEESMVNQYEQVLHDSDVIILYLCFLCLFDSYLFVCLSFDLRFCLSVSVQGCLFLLIFFFFYFRNSFLHQPHILMMSIQKKKEQI